MNTGFQHKKRRYETWTFQKKCSDSIPSFNLVEARGIEPLSENHLPRLSPSAADLLGFPSPDAERQASGYGSRLVHDGDSGTSPFTFTASSRLYPGRGIPGRDGSLIRPRAQQCCCRLFLKVADFKAGPHRYSLTKAHNPRRNLYAPISRDLHYKRVFTGCQTFIPEKIRKILFAVHGDSVRAQQLSGNPLSGDKPAGKRSVIAETHAAGRAFFFQNSFLNAMPETEGQHPLGSRLKGRRSVPVAGVQDSSVVLSFAGSAGDG